MNPWDYFRLTNDEQKKAECLYCNNIYSFSSTLFNLVSHMQKKHPKEINAEFVSPNALSVLVARHYTENSSESVICKYCSKRIHNKTAYMRNHLKNKHHKVYNNSVFRTSKGDEDIIYEIVDNVDDLDDHTVKFSSELWRHFEHEEDEAKCSLCKETMGNSIDEMKNHLEEHHTTVLDEIIAKAQKSLNEDSGEETNALEDDNDMYTEVVYLEDEPKKPSVSFAAKKRKISRRRSSQHTRAIKKERQPSESSEDYLIPSVPISRTKEPDTDDLNIFINYITSLLKRVPKENSQQLHLDIINLIMKAQHKAPTQNNVIETVTLDNACTPTPSTSNGAARRVITLPINETNTGPNQRVITVPLQSFISPSNDMIVLPQLYDIASSNSNAISSSGTATVETSSLSVPVARTETSISK